MNKEITIKVTDQDLKQMLKKYMVIPNSDKFLDLLTGHICKDRIAMEQIYKAMLGTYPTFNYKVGDFVYVDFSNLASWRVDKELTLQMPGVFDGKYIPCKIISKDIFSEAPYTVSYSAIKTGDKEPCVQEYIVPENYIYDKVDNLENLLDEIENTKIEEKEDLPF
jgi:hypothetical protein